MPAVFDSDFLDKVVFDNFDYIEPNVRRLKNNIDTIANTLNASMKLDPKHYVILIGDTHDDSSFIHNLIHAANRAKIKTIIHTGDIVHAGTLEKFKEFNGMVYGVLGNHDKRLGDHAQFVDVIKRHAFSFRYDVLRLSKVKKKILVTHGDNKKLLNRLYDHEKFHYLMYGHFHRKILLYNKLTNQFIINPGAYSSDPLPSDENDNRPSFAIVPIISDDPRNVVFFEFKNGTH